MRLRVFISGSFLFFFSFLQINIYEKNSKPGKRAEFTWLISPGIISEGTEKTQNMKIYVFQMKQKTDVPDENRSSNDEEIKCIR